MKKLIFALIILLGIFFRLWQLNTLPGGLFLDEINMAVDAKTLAQNGVDQYGHHFPFYFEDATDFKLPGYIYLATASYKIFGNQIFTMHLPSALAGIASIFLIGFLAKLLFLEKKRIFYFAAATFALSPFAIHFSRISYETNIALCFMLVYLIALIHVLQNKQTKLWLLIGSLAIFIANWTYPSPRVVIPLFTILFLIACYFFKYKDIKRKNIFLSCIFLGVAAATFIPTIIFPFADARQLNLVSGDLVGHPFFEAIILKTIAVFASYIRLFNLEFLFDKGDLFAYRHGTKEIGIFLLIFIVPFILGMWHVVRNINRKNFPLVLLLLFTLVAGLPSALSSEVPYGTRVLVMLIPYTLFIALGCEMIFAWMAKQKIFIKTSTVVLISIILAYQIGLFSYIYFVDFKTTSLPEFPTAPVQLANYITNFHKENPTKPIYFLDNRSCRIWGNDALYLWYFGNVPNKDMIAWNNAYRKVRYAYKKASPFEAYDQVTIPTAYISSENLYLYAGYKAEDAAPKGSLLVHCGYTLDTFNKNTEQLTQVFYMNRDTHDEPYYIVTTKK